MIPILFDGNSKEFSGNGIGRLTDCVSCLVTEERNGIFECEFEYPITGIHYDEIEEGRIILATHDEQKDMQPFTIYRRSASISGLVTFNAHHVSYGLSNVIVGPLTAATITDAFVKIKSNSLTENPFTFWTDKTSMGNFAVSVPTAARELLGGTSGSILDSFGGGDYQFDNYTVKLYANRGSDNGVTLRYGKNLTDLTYESDVMGLYSVVIPYWADGEGAVVFGGPVTGGGGILLVANWTDENGAIITDESGTPITFRYYETKTKTLNLSSEFESAPTVAQLEARARTYLNSNKPWIPKVNVKVDFVALWQTEEYKDIAPLERVRLCDTVTVYYEELGVNVKARVVKTVWNPLLDRYDNIEIGDAKTTFADTINTETSIILENVPTKAIMSDEIRRATEMISGGMGGNIVLNRDDNGKPIELLIMDTEDKGTAVNVWRWNLGGLGHSHSGYAGPFDDVAITQDGRINASMITTGTLKIGGSSDGGEMKIYDASNALIGSITKNGISLTGSITAIDGAIGGFDITSTAIKTHDVDIASNAENSIGLSSANFTRTINGTSRSGLRFAIGSNFGITGTGALYAANANLSGAFRNASGNEWIGINESVITGGYGAATHGMLDLSAQYSDSTYKVILENKVSDIILKVPNGKEVFRQEGNNIRYPVIVSGNVNNVGKYIKRIEFEKVDPDDSEAIWARIVMSDGYDYYVKFQGYAEEPLIPVGYDGTVTVGSLRMTFDDGRLIKVS